MKILPNRCPKCRGHLVLGDEDMSLNCEDCNYREETKDKWAYQEATEVAEEWGSKAKRLKPSLVGKIFLHPDKGLGEYLRETLMEGMRGLDLEDYDLNELRKYNLIEEEK